MKAFLLGGLLPVIAFTVIEEYYGILWGTVAGMVFGAGEILWEWRTQGRVSGMTWGGNALVLGLGALSLATQEGVWFKLQPALIEGAFALALWGSVLAGRPVLLMLAEKQGKMIPEVARPVLRGLTFRMGVFFGAHAGVAAWAALRWSTGAWALLKGVGFTGSLLAYGVAEFLWIRYRARNP